MDEKEEFEVLRAIEISPIHFTLDKTTKGYTWSISVRGKSIEEVMQKIKDADEKFRLTWGRL